MEFRNFLIQFTKLQIKIFIAKRYANYYYRLTILERKHYFGSVRKNSQIFGCFTESHYLCTTNLTR